MPCLVDRSGSGELCARFDREADVENFNVASKTVRGQSWGLNVRTTQCSVADILTALYRQRQTLRTLVNEVVVVPTTLATRERCQVEDGSFCLLFPCMAVE